MIASAEEAFIIIATTFAHVASFTNECLNLSQKRSPQCHSRPWATGMAVGGEKVVQSLLLCNHWLKDWHCSSPVSTTKRYFATHFILTARIMSHWFTHSNQGVIEDYFYQGVWGLRKTNLIIDKQNKENNKFNLLLFSLCIKKANW
mgnify:CR=1 FL=1